MKSITTTALILGALLVGVAPYIQTVRAAEPEQAAASDASRHALELGFKYDNGLGVPVDRTKAADLYRQAAEQGSLDGMFYLGQLYERGDGVPLDKAEAYKWLKAAEEKNSDVRDARQALEDNMSAAEIEDGRARLTAWKAQR